ncbi:MAG: YitT family protein [Fusobacterium perfoetens]|uniref:YitT family protein n=1 Tax=Fusobacterium perfoetens TaxID=852 RepID=UPI0023F4A8B6|nr:YitT family protein [Fusobacterium perfoetens]MCI6152949.1 YitT family protein [Fusobacterium perfoetens]MDY3237361.1 YitT family protein [Fusobacterium perfoetens]
MKKTLKSIFLETNFKDIIKDTFIITLGAFIYAFGVNYFFVANKMADGGVAGICTILYFLFGFNISTSYFLINIPLIILGYKLIGGKFIIKTFYGTAMTSLAFRILKDFQGPMNDKIMASLFGGLLIGIGLGSIFMAGGSSGGSDILVKILNKYFDISVGKAFLVLDFIVLSLLGFLFGKEVFMYTLVGLFTSTKVIDVIQEGLDTSKSVGIISNKSDEIKDKIMEELDRGTTLLIAKGGYKGDPKEIVYCIVSRYEVSSVKKIVKNIDRNAFIFISEVSEVLGEGFKNIDNN